MTKDYNFNIDEFLSMFDTKYSNSNTDIFIDEIVGICKDSIKTSIKDGYLNVTGNKIKWILNDEDKPIKQIMEFNKNYSISKVETVEKIEINIDEGLILYKIIRKNPETKEIKITVA